MPDNWLYVFAAYGVAAVVLTAYWRHLARRERDLAALARRTPSGAGRAPMPTSAAPRAR